MPTACPSPTLRRACRLAVATVAVVGCGRPAPTVVDLPPPEVTVARPVAREVTEQVEFTGNAAAVETVEIKARVSGFITRVHFVDGQQVRQGQPLFSIDERPYAIARDAATAEVARHVAELAELDSEVARDRPLLPKGVVTQEQFEIVVAKRDMAKAAADKARAALAQAELDLGFCTVSAPIDGRISTKRVTVGDLVSGASGSATPLTMIVSTNPIHVYFNADERSLLLSREQAIAARHNGGAAAVEWRNIKDLAIPVDVGLVTDGGFPRHGILDFIDVAVKAATGTVRCRAVLDNPDGLIAPGMFVRVRMPFGDPAPALLISDRAIGIDQGRRYVCVVGGDGRVEHRTIVPGFLDGDLRVVTKGLAAGDRVIVAGLHRAREGAVVRPVESALNAAPPAVPAPE
jgi:RND family efflux transporter MFP subunit